MTCFWDNLENIFLLIITDIVEWSNIVLLTIEIEYLILFNKYGGNNKIYIALLTL